MHLLLKMSWDYFYIKAYTCTLFLSNHFKSCVDGQLDCFHYSAISNEASTYILVCLSAQSLQSCPTLCNPMDCNLSAFSVHGILQGRILKWVAMLSSRDLSNPGIKPRSPSLQADSLPSEPPGKPSDILSIMWKLLIWLLNLILLFNSFPILCVFWFFNNNEIHFKMKKIAYPLEWNKINELIVNNLH